MDLSKHNIISDVFGEKNKHFIVNVLSGNADILSSDELNNLLNGNIPDQSEWIQKGYIVDAANEEKSYKRKYLDFIDARDTDEVQIFYVPSYSCNFDCSYCYQDGYLKEAEVFNTEVADAFFSYIISEFRDRRKYITLFGGEPLPGNRQSIEFISDFVTKCRKNNLDLAIVTNGYRLSEYINILKQVNIREVQVTLDGPAEIHNARRPLKNGGQTFENIVKGIDEALNEGIPINLRVVVDRENIDSLPRLADFAIQKGWTSSPLFKTQLGRNYELHFCQSENTRLYSRIELYKDLFHIIDDHPQLLDFHKPAYSVAKFLFENGELPDPLFDSCPGCKTEWAFDYTGKICSCTATVGKPGEELGTFFPDIKLNNDLIDQWQQRDVLSIKACQDCNLKLACGGGCASVAYNRDNTLHAPDCRPVKELLELGIALYMEKE